jgi:hypothetical protein
MIEWFFVGNFEFKINWKITTLFPKRNPPEALTNQTKVEGNVFK